MHGYGVKHIFFCSKDEPDKKNSGLNINPLFSIKLRLAVFYFFFLNKFTEPEGKKKMIGNEVATE